MRFFIFFILFCFLKSSLLANGFSQKKIIKIGKNEDNFEMIDLNQKVSKLDLDQQKALFDSSILIEKKSSLVKDKDVDFAVVLTFRQNFAYFLDGFSVNAKDFSTAFSKNLMDVLKLNFINSAANGIYQSSRTLSDFSPKDAKFVNAAPFLRQENDKSKIYAKFVDYIVVVNLQDFYVKITNYFITTTKRGVAEINLKIISTSNAKIISDKNIKLELSLKNDTKVNVKELLNQMPEMLAKVVEKECKDLKIET